MAKAEIFGKECTASGGRWFVEKDSVLEDMLNARFAMIGGTIGGLRENQAVFRATRILGGEVTEYDEEPPRPMGVKGRVD